LYYIADAIYVKQDGESDKIDHAHKDHLDSIIKLTDGNGNSVFETSYDAWGQQTIIANTVGFYCGCTGHEHLPKFGLINMNGRLYDLLPGRFLRSDTFVQMPDYSQSFNRYSYCSK
jgi:RHS repeat-associated protein